MLVIRLRGVPSGWGSGGDSTGTQECSVGGGGAESWPFIHLPPQSSLENVPGAQNTGQVC